MELKKYEKKINKAVEYLTEFPESIYDAWAEPKVNKGGILFMWVNHKADSAILDDVERPFDDAGCLTMLRQNVGYCVGLVVDGKPRKRKRKNKRIRKIIEQDERIPKNGEDIKLEHLPIFASYQLAFEEYRRKGKYKKLIKQIKKLQKCTITVD